MLPFADAIAYDLADGQDALERLIAGQVWNGDFAADDDAIRFGVSFASDAAVAILFQACVQDGIGNGVTDFVRMAFADGLRREDKGAGHSGDGWNVWTNLDALICGTCFTRRQF